MTRADDWARGPEASRPDAGLHELFEAQALRTPDASAVTDGDTTLSYAELDRRANRLAHHLRRQGIGVETRVGVCMQRSVPLVVALLATLKAGATYVPLDPHYPPDRRAFMLRDAGVALLVADATAWDLVPRGPGIPRLEPDTAGDGPSTRPQVPIHPASLAYVIYTSGSTGRPKGVMVPHRAICNHTLWIQERLQLRPGDRLLHKTPLGFDPSLTEFMAPLVAGALLVLAPDHAHQDPAYLVDAVIEGGITVLQVVPTLLRLLLEQRRLSQCRSLRMLLSGGEALPAELVERLRALLPVEVHNLYGPTETAIDVTCLPAVEVGDRVTVPIGRPIANTTVHLLDADLRPVQRGEISELYIGGLSLARGYLGRPSLTAERFVPDPFGSAGEPPGQRLYRTGDLGRYLSDGFIEFAGRTDQQLKFRGVRIEPGEIEAALREHPSVLDAAVVAQDGPASAQRLVAFVAAEPSAGNGQGRELPLHLRDYLSARLPSYLVPSSIAVLNALPRTPNGKLDRRGLPTVPPETPRASDYVAPRTPLEEALARAFARLLGVERIGLHDPLFDLGADSLVVAQLGAHVTNTYDVDLPLFLLFAVPTLAGVAEVVQTYALHGKEQIVTRSTSLVTAEAELDPSVVPDWGA
jgi:amino acid adenylation domain-containing protein